MSFDEKTDSNKISVKVLFDTRKPINQTLLMAKGKKIFQEAQKACKTRYLRYFKKKV